jgi:acetyl-CoA C-acetyltransferase
VFVLDWLRTPRGKGTPRGSLHHVTPVDLVVHLQRALVARTGLDPAAVEDVVLGAASQVGEQGANLARTATLRAGWGSTVPGGTVNRFCASGLDAVAQTAARIRAGDLDLAVAGGVESVSRMPMFSDGGPLWTGPGAVHMGVAADLDATIDGWTRDQLDGYAVETQAKAARAWDAGHFARSVVPVGPFAVDELVRRDTTMESLAALPPAFADLGRAGQDAAALAAYPSVGAILTGWRCPGRPNQSRSRGSRPATLSGGRVGRGSG